MLQKILILRENLLESFNINCLQTLSYNVKYNYNRVKLRGNSKMNMQNKSSFTPPPWQRQIKALRLQRCL